MDNKLQLQQVGQGDGEGQPSSGSGVAAVRWLSMQCPTFAKNKNGKGPMIQQLGISLLLSWYAGTEASPQ